LISSIAHPKNTFTIQTAPALQKHIIPASKAAPRFVSPEAIAAFEANNPALSGIGEVMLERGLWVLTNPQRGWQK